MSTSSRGMTTTRRRGNHKSSSSYSFAAAVAPLAPLSLLSLALLLLAASASAADVAGQSKASGEGRGHFARAGNAQCSGTHCHPGMESSISSSFAHTAITGHDPRGLSNAMSQVILPEASTAVVPLTSALSQSAGYGHISNSVSAVSRTFEEGAEHVDPKAPLAKVTIGSFLQGSGLARGAGTAIKDDTNAVLAINLVNGTSAYPSHHNPYAFLSSVTDAELKQDNTFEAMSDAYLNGMGQASGFGGDDSKGYVYTNAQGYGLANGYAKLKFDRQDPQQVVEAHTTRGTKAAGFSQGESLKDKCSENGMDVECDTDGADEGFENLVDMVVDIDDLFKGFKTDPQVHLGRKLLQSQVGGMTR